MFKAIVAGFRGKVAQKNRTQKAFQVSIFKVGVQTVVPCGTTFPSQFRFIITEDVIFLQQSKTSFATGS